MKRTLIISLTSFFFLTACSGDHGAENPASISLAGASSEKECGQSYTVLPANIEETAYYVDSSYNGTSDGSKEKPWKKISDAVNTGLKPGDAVIVKGGTYRETVDIGAKGTSDKPIYFLAKDGDNVVIKGSDVVTGWTSEGGCVYSHNDWKYKMPWLPDPDNGTVLGLGEKSDEYDKLGQDWNAKLEYLKANAPDALYSLMRGQVFADEEPLKEVIGKEKLSAGTFYVEPQTNKLYVCLEGSSDPSNHLMEGSVRDGLVIFDKDSSYVVLKGFKLRHSTSPVRALAPAEDSTYAVVVAGKGHTLEGNEIKYVNGAGMNITDTAGHKFYKNSVSFEGHVGITAYNATDTVFNCNTTSFNGWRTQYLQKGWEDGGMKLGRAKNVVISNHTAAFNTRHGIWFDSYCYGNSVSKGSFYGHSDSAVRLEACDSQTAADGNIISENLIYSNAYGVYYDGSYHTTVANDLFAYNFYAGIGTSTGKADIKNNDAAQNIFFGNGIAAVSYNVDENNTSFNDNIFYYGSADDYRSGRDDMMSGVNKISAPSFIKEGLKKELGYYDFIADGWNPSVAVRFSTYVKDIAAWQLMTGDKTSTMEDPLFEKPADADFRLKKDSPAIVRNIGPSSLRPE